ncbi:hypothetical protein [Nonomuraea turcica]|uniref:hypothetical protein n=1 Tax=Nonomuraea sp. G32 TaxID=3067274 RepID=UPI00273AD9DC|nr:hypothetical protein [Nonomuraea sp. G32]MDP4501170.1 hypothetical protein [Nonomuraea sp. G32]
MSFERRLREGLVAAAARVEPDTERALVRVRLHRRRRRLFRPLVAVVAVAMTVLLVPVVLALSAERRDEAVTRELAATYTAELPDTSGLNLAGRWFLTVRPDGSANVGGPPGLTVRGPGPAGTYVRIDDERLRTNLFYNDLCTGEGLYGWRRDGDVLTFTVVEDTCAARRMLLTSSPWSR